MLTTILPATERVLRRAGLGLSDIDLFEGDRGARCGLQMCEAGGLANATILEAP
jgi:acetyl-CoA acetyltransferase